MQNINIIADDVSKNENLAEKDHGEQMPEVENSVEKILENTEIKQNIEKISSNEFVENLNKEANIDKESEINKNISVESNNIQMQNANIEIEEKLLSEKIIENNSDKELSKENIISVIKIKELLKEKEDIQTQIKEISNENINNQIDMKEFQVKKEESEVNLKEILSENTKNEIEMQELQKEREVSEINIKGLLIENFKKEMEIRDLPLKKENEILKENIDSEIEMHKIKIDKIHTEKDVEVITKENLNNVTEMKEVSMEKENILKIQVSKENIKNEFEIQNLPLDKENREVDSKEIPKENIINNMDVQEIPNENDNVEILDGEKTPVNSVEEIDSEPSTDENTTDNSSDEDYICDDEEEIPAKKENINREGCPPSSSYGVNLASKNKSNAKEVEIVDNEPRQQQSTQIKTTDEIITSEKPVIYVDDSVKKVIRYTQIISTLREKGLVVSNTPGQEPDCVYCVYKGDDYIIYSACVLILQPYPFLLAVADRISPDYKNLIARINFLRKKYDSVFIISIGVDAVVKRCTSGKNATLIQMAMKNSEQTPRKRKRTNDISSIVTNMLLCLEGKVSTAVNNLIQFFEYDSRITLIKLNDKSKIIDWISALPRGLLKLEKTRMTQKYFPEKLFINTYEKKVKRKGTYSEASILRRLLMIQLEVIEDTNMEMCKQIGLKYPSFKALRTFLKSSSNKAGFLENFKYSTSGFIRSRFQNTAVGPAVSKRIYRFLVSKDPNEIL